MNLNSWIKTGIRQLYILYSAFHTACDFFDNEAKCLCLMCNPTAY